MNADDTPAPANAENRRPPSEPYLERGLASDAAEALITGGGITVGGLAVKDAYGWAKEKLARPQPSQVILPPGVDTPSDE